MIKQFIQEGGKLNIRERSDERTAQEAYLTKYAQKAQNEISTDPNSRQKNEDLQNLYSYASKSTANEPVTVNMDSKLLKSQENFSGPLVSSFGIGSDVRVSRYGNTREQIGASQNSTDFSNVNARCSSFENKYRQITQQKYTVRPSSTERVGLSSLIGAHNTIEQTKDSKNIARDMIFKSSFAQKFYSS